MRATSDYVYTVQDLRNGTTSDAHVTRLKHYTDSSLDERAIIEHAIQSEHGMPVARLLKLVKNDSGIGVLVRWKGLSSSEDTVEPLQQVFEDVPALLQKLLTRQNTPSELASEARAELRLEKEGV